VIREDQIRGTARPRAAPHTWSLRWHAHLHALIRESVVIDAGEVTAIRQAWLTSAVGRHRAEAPHDASHSGVCGRTANSRSLPAAP
jgi:hypothetical protein